MTNATKRKTIKPWSITIESYGGFCPAWFRNSYPTYANKDQASDMKNVDITDPNVLTQGPKPTDLTNGNESGAVTTLISSILKTAVTSGITYAVGGNKIYKLSNNEVTNDGTYPITIDKGGVTGENATDLVYYKSAVYVFYNYTGGGDIGKLDITADTLDEDWGSTVPTGATTLEEAPHYAINGGDDVVYFTNGKYVGKIDGTTLDTQALDFWENAQTVSLAWNLNRVYIAVNRPNIAGSNFNQSGIYKWNGVSSSWEGDPIEVSGKIGALYTKNGIVFVWWQDATDSWGYWFGYVSGSTLVPLRRYSGSLPNQAQVGEWRGFICWMSDEKFFIWGASDVDIEVALSHYGSAKYSTNVGAMASPFGNVLIASSDGTHYSLAKLGGYTTDAYWKTKVFKVNLAGWKSQIDLIQVETEPLSTGARVDFVLTYDKGKSTKNLSSIMYSTENKTLHKILDKSIEVEDFRLDIDWSNGSETNPVKIRTINIEGHWTKNL